jgi:hypothetical protein
LHRDRDPAHQALEPWEAPRADARAGAPGLDPLARHAELLAVRKQHVEGAVGVEDRLGVEDPHRHRAPVALDDLAQARGALRDPGLGLVHHELGEAAPAREVEDRSEPVGSIALLERSP